ncbi:hypothetical protein JCM24511_07077 [Saitozyma sp. JCM 24511]|nr:hypothetical protein JCM24511_07077 [Saitozyma sp. JCM 24511]
MDRRLALRQLVTISSASRRGALPRLVPAARFKPTSFRRHASNVPRAPLPMPPDMPRENYAEPAMYTVSYLSRVIKFLIYGAVGLGITGYASFEGLHLYVENVCLATPSRDPSGDEYGWQEENQGWTGGAKGGTDSRLGWKARHALRGAWICQEWGAGGTRASIGRSVHPDFRGMIGSKINKVDRGYELAEEYIDIAIAEARKRGLVFPPNISAVSSTPETLTTGADPTAVDLLLLKAGVLERIATPQTLGQAKDIYERVLAASGSEAPAQQAKTMRLAGKVGDLSARLGEGGADWWAWGLRRAGVTVPEPPEPVAKGWFKSASKRAPVSTESTSTTAPSPLSPPVLRATISLLISTEANLALSSQLERAASVQDFAAALIPTITPSSPESALHDLWLSHRASLLLLHRANVFHALSRPALELATAASVQSDGALLAIPTYPTSNPLYPAAKLLHRDAAATSAEAAWTKGLLLEKTDLEHASDCFEKAMALVEERGSDWEKYWRSFARVRSRMEAAMPSEADLNNE